MDLMESSYAIHDLGKYDGSLHLGAVVRHNALIASTIRIIGVSIVIRYT